MAEQLRYKNTDSSPGGSGLTNATTGVDRAYASYSEWEANEEQALSGSGDTARVLGDAPSGVADTAAVIVSGWTTSVTEYITIEANVGNEAIKTGWDASRDRLEVTDTHPLMIQEDYVRIKGLQIRPIFSSATFKYGIWVDTITATNNYINLSNNRIHISSGITYGGIAFVDNDVIVDTWNNIIYGEAGSPRRGIFCQSNTLNISNNIIYGITLASGVGIDHSSGTVTVENNAVFNNTDDFDTGMTLNFNASDDGDGSNPIAPSGGDWLNEYVNPAIGNFEPLNTGNIFEAGIAISGLTLDMSGNAWNDPPTIGANEFVSGVVPVSPNDLILSSIILEQTKATPTIISDDLILSSIILESPIVSAVASPDNLILSAIILQETSIGGTVSPDDLILSSIILESPGVSGIISPDSLVLRSIILEQAIIIPSVVPEDLVLSAIILGNASKHSDITETAIITINMEIPKITMNLSPTEIEMDMEIPKITMRMKI